MGGLSGSSDKGFLSGGLGVSGDVVVHGETWAEVHDLLDFFKGPWAITPQNFRSVIHADIKTPPTGKIGIHPLLSAGMAVSVELPSTTVRFIPNGHCIMIENDWLTFDHHHRLITGRAEQASNRVVIMIAPDQVDILALDLVSVILAVVKISLFRGESPVAQVIESVVGSDHLVDIVDQDVVHHLDAFIADPVLAGMLGLPIPVVP